MNTKQIRHGIVGGVAGGIIFGVQLELMGMLPMIGKLAGQASAGVGLLVHLVNSVIIGVVFAVVLGRLVNGLASGVRYGLLYGIVWWFLGPLTLMPLLLGMGLTVNWSLGAMAEMLPSLVGHLVYGAILGATYGWLEQRGSGRRSLASTGMTAEQGRGG